MTVTDSLNLFILKDLKNLCSIKGHFDSLYLIESLSNLHSNAFNYSHEAVRKIISRSRPCSAHKTIGNLDLSMLRVTWKSLFPSFLQYFPRWILLELVFGVMTLWLKFCPWLSQPQLDVSTGPSHEQCGRPSFLIVDHWWSFRSHFTISGQHYADPPTVVVRSNNNPWYTSL